MSDDEHGLAFFGKVEHNVEYFTDHFRIEGSGYFVEKQDFGMHAQGADDGHTLFLTTGKLSGIAVGFVTESDTFEKLHGFLFYFFFFTFLYLDRCQCDIVDHGQVREQLVALEYHTDLLTKLGDGRAAFFDFFAVQGDGAALDLFQCIDAAKQGTLTAATGADDDDDFALMDIEVDVVENVQSVIFFFQMFDFQY